MQTVDETNNETRKHILDVSSRIGRIVQELVYRMSAHDLSKLNSPEVEAFNIATEKLKTLKYGSDEYKQSLEDLKPTLKHHYINNSHHPEHYGYMECNSCQHRYSKYSDGCCPKCGSNESTFKPNINGMNLVDIIEMLCDWKAATLRTKDGDIDKSLEINKERFGISDQLYEIMKNTLKII